MVRLDPTYATVRLHPTYGPLISHLRLAYGPSAYGPLTVRLHPTYATVRLYPNYGPLISHLRPAYISLTSRLHPAYGPLTFRLQHIFFKIMEQNIFFFRQIILFSFSSAPKSIFLFLQFFEKCNQTQILDVSKTNLRLTTL